MSVLLDAYVEDLICVMKDGNPQLVEYAISDIRALLNSRNIIGKDSRRIRALKRDLEGILTRAEKQIPQRTIAEAFQLLESAYQSLTQTHPEAKNSLGNAVQSISCACIKIKELTRYEKEQFDTDLKKFWDKRSELNGTLDAIRDQRWPEKRQQKT